MENQYLGGPATVPQSVLARVSPFWK